MSLLFVFLYDYFHSILKAKKTNHLPFAIFFATKYLFAFNYANFPSKIFYFLFLMHFWHKNARKKSCTPEKLFN